LQEDRADSHEKAAAIILFGSPGSGKGTQARLLGECLAGPHISTGDMLRDHIAAGDEIGREAQRLIKAGKLVPDDMVNALVVQRLKKPDCGSGVILDGYPRTVNQAKVLLELMDRNGFRPSVVHLVVDYEKIVARLSGRRQCPVCGTLYSLTTNPPRVAGICDREGATLVTREDDREAVIRERLHEYDVQTVPILNFFRESGVPLFEVNAGDATPEQVRQRVCGQLVDAGVIRATAGLK
jgi:adenylate kinase